MTDVHGTSGFGPRRGVGPQDSPLVAFAQVSTRASRQSSFLFSFDAKRQVGGVAGLAVLLAVGLNLPSLAIAGATVAIVLALASVTHSFGLGARARPWRECPLYLPSGARVACVGRPDRLGRLAQEGPLIDEFIEPFACIAPFALQAQARAVWMGVSVGLIVGSGVLVLTHGGALWIATAVYTGLYAGGFAAAAAWPTYLRAVPGSLDILDRGFLGRSERRRVTIDLRADEVLVDLNQRALYVFCDARVCEVALRGVSDVHALSAAILRAAISTHAAPPLPDDELVG